jgi:hypothetical protein
MLLRDGASPNVLPKAGRSASVPDPAEWSGGNILCWGCSSAGRAPRWHRGGRRFEPVQLHLKHRPGRKAGAVSLAVASLEVRAIDLVELQSKSNTPRMVDAKELHERPGKESAEYIAADSKPKPTDSILDPKSRSLRPSCRSRGRNARLVAELRHELEATAVDDLGRSRAHLPAPLLRQGRVQGLVGRGLVEVQHCGIEPLAKQPAARIEYRRRLAQQVFVADLHEVGRIELVSQATPSPHWIEPVAGAMGRFANPAHAHARPSHVTRISAEEDELGARPDLPDPIDSRMDRAASDRLPGAIGELAPQRSDEIRVVRDALIDGESLGERSSVLRQPCPIPVHVRPA